MKKSVNGMIKLDNGDFLWNDYGKYKSGLTIIIPKEIVNNEGDFECWRDDLKSSELNLDRGDLSFIRGDFFVSKKGTKCFKISPLFGKHYLVRDNWGGAFNSYLGGTLPQDQLYYRRASSNGGGSGYDYAIIPLNWKYTISEDDL